LKIIEREFCGQKKESEEIYTAKKGINTKKPLKPEDFSG
jgi:hypothetical protein